MAFVNYNNKEITVKIVYYGPALSGKTTCLHYVYESGEYRKKGKLITLDTDGDRTLFFDFLPIEIGKLGDYSIKMQLYTVPGQVAYNTTRKLVLQGSDGIVFVADSQMVMREQNIDSFNNLKENLKANNISFAEMPLIYQYNKRDLREVMPVELINRDLNPENKAFFPSIGTTGENILEGLHAIMKMVIIHLKNKLSIFQKDKTVMFSRDEVTDSIAKKEKVPEPRPTISKPVSTPVMPAPATTNIKPKTQFFGGDTEKEEIFELSSPMADVTGDSLKSNVFNQEDEIFNLGDESRFDDNGSDLDVPEVVINDELDDIRETLITNSLHPVAQQLPPEPLDMDSSEEDEGSGNEYVLNSKDMVSGGVDIPIHIDVPDDKDEITINLNLRIVIKKKS